MMAAMTVGCSDGKPADFPAVSPLTITVTDAGAPVADAIVTLYPQGAKLGSCGIGGVTDAQGVVEVMTSMSGYQGSGCPEGKFKITVVKEPIYPSQLPQDQVNQMTPEESSAYAKKLDDERATTPRPIPNTLESLGKTPLLIDVKSGEENKLDVNIAEYK